MIQIPAMALLERVRRAVPAEVWLILAAFLLLVVFLTVAYFRGVDAEKDRQAIEAAAGAVKASSGRETAAGERSVDQVTNQQDLARRNADAYATPDSAPSPRTFSRRCRQLREAGVSVPECG